MNTTKKIITLLIAGLFATSSIAQEVSTPVFKGEAAGTIILGAPIAPAKQEPVKVEPPAKPAKAEKVKPEVKPAPVKVEAPKPEPKPAPAVKVEAPKPVKVEAPKPEPKPVKVEAPKPAPVQVSVDTGSESKATKARKAKFHLVSIVKFKSGSMRKPAAGNDFAAIVESLKHANPTDVVWVKGLVTAEEAATLNVEEFGVHRADAVRKELAALGYTNPVRILHSKEDASSSVKVFIEHTN